jgi:hypothetical protein
VARPKYDAPSFCHPVRPPVIPATAFTHIVNKLNGKFDMLLITQQMSRVLQVDEALKIGLPGAGVNAKFLLMLNFLTHKLISL